MPSVSCYSTNNKDTPINKGSACTQTHGSWNWGLTVLVGTLILRNSASLHSTGQGAWTRVKLGPWVFSWKTQNTPCKDGTKCSSFVLDIWEMLSPRITGLVLHFCVEAKFLHLNFYIWRNILPDCLAETTCFPDHLSELLSQSNAANRQEVGAARHCNQLHILRSNPSYFTSEPDATNPCHLADPLKDWQTDLASRITGTLEKKNRWRLGTFGEARSRFFSLVCCCILFLTHWVYFLSYHHRHQTNMIY